MKCKTLLFVSSFLFSVGCLCLNPQKAKANHASYCNNHPNDVLSGCNPFSPKKYNKILPPEPKPKPSSQTYKSSNGYPPWYNPNKPDNKSHCEQSGGMWESHKYYGTVSNCDVP